MRPAHRGTLERHGGIRWGIFRLPPARRGQQNEYSSPPLALPVPQQSFIMNFWTWAQEEGNGGDQSARSLLATSQSRFLIDPCRRVLESPSRFLWRWRRV